MGSSKPDTTERVVLIEFIGTGRGRVPFHVETVNGDGNLRVYDVERSRRFGGVYRHCSGIGGRPYLEHAGSLRWWCMPGFEPHNDNKKGRRRLHRKPRGRFSPEHLLATVEDDDGVLCRGCNDYIPEYEECPHRRF